MRRAQLVPLLSGVVAVLLVVGVVAVATHHTSHSAKPVAAAVTTTSSSSSTSSTSSTSTTSTTAPATVAAFVPDAERFVEAHRGLRFKQPVTVTVLDDAAFRQRLLADQQDDPGSADQQKSQKLFRALGFIPPGMDLAAAEQRLVSDTVSGFYDSKAKALFVRGVAPTPYVRQVVVHELTHALQDQYFTLYRPDLAKSDDERFDGFQGLYEGDATRIDAEYRGSLPAPEQGQAEAEEKAQGGSGDPNVPDALLTLLDFPYEVGPAFAKALLASGGQERLDAAFTNPPTTTEQLIHPAKFVAGEGPTAIAPPPAGGKTFDQGVLGELGIAVMLDEAYARGTLSDTQVLTAAGGWGGDQYVAWDQGAKACVRDSIVMDSPTDTTELLQALRVWAKDQPGASVTGAGPITITSCA